jgi:hypothetical protein
MKFAIRSVFISAALVAIAGCSTSSNGAVLPVDRNPIVNTATARTLAIDSVLVENNVDVDGKAVDDHLEIALSNSGTTDLVGVQVFYSFVDQTTKRLENYYLLLPADFSVTAKGKRVIHFDKTSQRDHLPVNKFSSYYINTNEQQVTVVVSAAGAAPQTLTVTKDAGGAESAD